MPSHKFLKPDAKKKMSLVRSTSKGDTEREREREGRKERDRESRTKNLNLKGSSSICSNVKVGELYIIKKLLDMS